MTNFSNRLIQWYLVNKRDLPWRNSKNSYHIWLSEIILQQTRVAQGLPYYNAFVDVFPTVLDLANATEEQVLKLWQGLGYYSRARNLHKTAKVVAFEMEGVFPTEYKNLLKLVGVGEYTAAAIASFAYNEAVAVVDGNVFRVLARYFDMADDISEGATKKKFQTLAQELLPIKDASTFNQAMMEFGAIQCVPKNPNCEVCIFNDSCLALKNKNVTQRPVKSKKIKVKKRYLNYLVFEDETKNTLVEQRIENEIWKNLYQFPLIETNEIVEEVVFESLLKTNIFCENTIQNYRPYGNIVKHKLTHQELFIRFWNIKVSGTLEAGINFEDAKKLPFPIVIFNFIEKY